MGSGHKQRRIEVHKVAPYIHHKKDKCEKCGENKSGAEYDKEGFMIRKARGGSNLTVHHIDNNPFNNDPSNLQTLCRKCHDEIHNNYPPTT